MALVIAPKEGSFRGGTAVRLLGNDLDVSSCQDDFSDGVIGALWSNISSGSGTVLERGTDGAVGLDTGSTAGSIAGLRTVATMFDADASASFRLVQDSRPAKNATNIIAELSLRVGTSRAGIQISTSERGLEMIARVLAGGAVSSNISATIARGIEPGGEITLRLLRFDRFVRLYLSTIRIFAFEWPASATSIELLIRNDAAAVSRVRTDLFHYTRRPVVTLAGEPFEDLVLTGNNRAAGTAPAVSARFDLVDMTATGCAGAPATYLDAFTYIREDDLIRFPTRDTALVVVNDVTLTKRRAREQ